MAGFRNKKKIVRQSEIPKEKNIYSEGNPQKFCPSCNLLKLWLGKKFWITPTINIIWFHLMLSTKAQEIGFVNYALKLKLSYLSEFQVLTDYTAIWKAQSFIYYGLTQIMVIMILAFAVLAKSIPELYRVTAWRAFCVVISCFNGKKGLITCRSSFSLIFLMSGLKAKLRPPSLKYVF